MSILAHLIRRRNSKRYARPTPKVRECRRNSKTTPFGYGLVSDAVSTVKAWSVNGWHFELTEDSLWYERENPTALYTLHATHDTETDSHPFDTLGQAETFAWHLSTPPYPEEVPPAHYPDETPTLDDSAYFEPSQEDRQWYAAHDHEVSSEMDEWLDNAAPDNYMDLAMEGGVEW